MHDWLKIDSLTDIDALTGHIDPEYSPDVVAARLKESISDTVASVLVEHDYIDKDYRSTYYHFYSKKGQRYRPDCVRLHFFDREISFDEATLKLTCADGQFSNHYLGFMVLRPTGIGTIGRSVLSPDIRRGAPRLNITASHKVHLLGYDLIVQGFPSMEQHTDISVCAHAASWSILRHYSESYKIYRERLVYDITTMAQPHNPGGIVPSLGLALSQAERIFQEAKTFPVVVARDVKNDQDHAFYRQLMAYVESKFPLFAADHTHGHAVAIVGYNWSSEDPAEPGIRFAWDEVESFSVIDDHHLPYLPVAKSGGSGEYSIQDVDSFIVGLPEKIYYPADAVDQIAPEIMKIGAPLGLPRPEDTVIRYFITTGSGLRRFTRRHESEYDPDLFKVLMRLPYSQFVWVVEIASREQWGRNQLAGRAIIDATASPVEYYPFWLVHGMESALVFRREKVNASPSEMISITYPPRVSTGFSRMDQNLRPTGAR